MTKPLIKIKEWQFDTICFWFHKGCRWSEAKGSGPLWRAIADFENEDGELGSYDKIMQFALREAGIKVIKNKQVK